MLQVFSNDISTIVLDNNFPQKNIETIKNHIKLCNCKYMTIDIRSINLLDACRISTICSAEHYMKYPDGNIKWIVNSEKVKECTSDMNLGNSEFVCK